MKGYNWLKGFVITVSPASGPATYHAFPGLSFEAEDVPYVRSREPVRELLDGRRVAARREDKSHIDIKIEWDQMEDVDYDAYASFIVAARAAPSTTTFLFCPRVAANGLVPMAGVESIPVVPAWERGQLSMKFENHIRRRPGKLTLKGAELIDTADLPAWMLE